MPDFEESLAGKDYGYLRIIAEMWDLDLKSGDLRSAIQELVGGIIQKPRVLEMEASLPEDSISALRELHAHGGRLPWQQFVRAQGALREMGPGRRDREKPFRSPVSTTEVLYYRAMIQRGIFDTERGPIEFAYIPDDLLGMLSFAQEDPPFDPGRRAKIKEIGELLLAGDQILDHACTLLAGLRIPLGQDEFQRHWQFGEDWPYPLQPEDLKILLYSLGIIDNACGTKPEKVRDYLEMDRNQALFQLAIAWMETPEYDDLRRMPGIKIEGEWRNNPLQTKKFILDLMRKVTAGEWWNLATLIETVHEEQPEFQRSAGEYDSWYIRDVQTDEYLRGFKHWDRIDGALLHYVIAGPLFWLGMVELAFAPPKMGDLQQYISAFRVTGTGSALLRGESPENGVLESERFQIRSDGQIRVPVLASRPARYQVARFCHWEKQKEEDYYYRITPESLSRAARQGLKVSHLLSILANHADVVPPGLERTLQRWEQRGAEAYFEQVTILRVGHPEIIQSLRKTKAARFLGNPLGPTAIVIKPGSITKLRSTLAEMGFLAQINIEEGATNDSE